MNSLRKLKVILGWVVLLGSAALAQTYRGGIAGSVADTSGAVVPTAVVTITNVATGLTRTQSASAEGDFNFPDLPTGTYSVSVVKPGFQKYSQEVEVAVGKISSLAVTLGVAAQTQQVDVQAAAATLEPMSPL